MRTLRHVLSVCVLSLAVQLLGATPSWQNAAPQVTCNPKQATVYIDDVPLGWGSGSFWPCRASIRWVFTTTVTKPYTTKFTAESGKTVHLAVVLELFQGPYPAPGR